MFSHYFFRFRSKKLNIFVLAKCNLTFRLKLKISNFFVRNRKQCIFQIYYVKQVFKKANKLNKWQNSAVNLGIENFKHLYF